MSKKKKNRLLDSKVFWAVISLLASLFIWVYITGTQEEIITKDFSSVEFRYSAMKRFRQRGAMWSRTSARRPPR